MTKKSAKFSHFKAILRYRTSSYKSFDLKNKLPQMDDSEMLELLATDGMLVKRPLLIDDDFVLAGFKEAEWSERL